MSNRTKYFIAITCAVLGAGVISGLLLPMWAASPFGLIVGFLSEGAAYDKWPH